MDTKKMISREERKGGEGKIFQLRFLRVLRATHQLAKSKSEQLMK
jgi:hypothetical protein